MLAKGENTSAIYRVKITEKYAFVQTTSKIIKRDATRSSSSADLDEFDDSTTATTTATTNNNNNNNNDKIIYSSHSIIKYVTIKFKNLSLVLLISNGEICLS